MINNYDALYDKIIIIPNTIDNIILSSLEILFDNTNDCTSIRYNIFIADIIYNIIDYNHTSLTILLFNQINNFFFYIK